MTFLYALLLCCVGMARAPGSSSAPHSAALPCLAFMNQPRSANDAIVSRALHRGARRKVHHCWHLTFVNRAQCTQWKHFSDAELYEGQMLPAVDGGPASPVRARACIWVTVFREPVSRLLSAFHVCRNLKRGKWNPMCGWNPKEGGFAARPVDAHNATIAEWAMHFGSFTWQQLLLAPGRFRAVGRLCAPDAPGGGAVWQAGTGTEGTSGSGARDVALSAASVVPAVTPSKRHGGPRAPVVSGFECRQPRSWTEHRDALGAGADGRGTAGARALLRGLTAQLEAGQLFDTVGLVERWADTARLFDARVPLGLGTSGRPSSSASGGVLRWADALVSGAAEPAAQAEAAARAARQRERAPELERARRNPAVLEALHADLQLHAAACRLFERQLGALLPSAP